MTILKKTQKDDAVSPVVGVMLMLVVTIIIAALVAAFASGLGTDSSSTTTAIFTVQDLDTIPDQSGGDVLTHIYLVHRGGDTVSLPEIAVITEAYGSIHTYKASDADKYQLTSLSGKVSVGPNDILDVIIYDHDIHPDGNPNWAPTGTPIEWSIVDLTTNYKISNGKFIVP